MISKIGARSPASIPQEKSAAVESRAGRSQGLPPVPFGDIKDRAFQRARRAELSVQRGDDGRISQCLATPGPAARYGGIQPGRSTT